MSAYIKRRITTELPTTLEPGEEIYYQDANGNLTLWVGHEDGSAWPSVGYKEYVALMFQEGTNAPIPIVLSNTIGDVTWSRIGTGIYRTNTGPFGSSQKIYTSPYGAYTSSPNADDFYIAVSPYTSIDGYYIEIDTLFGATGVLTDDALSGAPLTIRVYP
jgi:hypothetical protein